MPIYDRRSTPGSPLDLDRAPLAPPDRIKPYPTMPGDDTESILGGPNVNEDGAGLSASSPTGIALAGVMQMMQGANAISSVIPGAIPPPLMQLIQQLMVTIPEIVRNMQQMTGAGGMLTNMGQQAMGQPMGPQPGMGMGGDPAMSMMNSLGGMSGARPPMA